MLQKLIFSIFVFLSSEFSNFYVFIFRMIFGRTCYGMDGDSWHSSKISIQYIVDEVAPIKKSSPMGLRADSFECDVSRVIRGL